MTGVRMGERVLQIGLGDPPLAAALAARPGMSGHSAMVVSDDPTAERARSLAAEAGALVDVHVTSPAHLPFDDRTFDVVIVHGAAAAVAALNAAARNAAMTEAYRVLRAGGRLIALEPGTAGGLSALLRRTPAPDPAAATARSTMAALEKAGFRPVRLLADREGYRFVEGLKT
jgi:ubiquinone/menaquinone biosynthesis C-methylase UbiE